MIAPTMGVGMLVTTPRGRILVGGSCEAGLGSLFWDVYGAPIGTAIILVIPVWEATLMVMVRVFVV